MGVALAGPLTVVLVVALLFGFQHTYRRGVATGYRECDALYDDRLGEVVRQITNPRSFTTWSLTIPCATGNLVLQGPTLGAVARQWRELDNVALPSRVSGTERMFDHY